MSDAKSSIIGHVDSIGRDRITGWAADSANTANNVKVQVTADGVVVAQQIARERRGDLTNVCSGSTSCYGFDIALTPPLSMWRTHLVSVSAEGSNLPKGTALINAVEDRRLGPGPVIVTTTGRSGSSLLMGHLARHPDIAVAGSHPYEVKLLIYYGLAFMLQISEADPVRSLDPDLMDVISNQYSIGRNPFNDPALSTHPAVRQYWEHRLPVLLKEAFSSAILGYYDAQRLALNRTSFQYFAEKMHPQHELRGAAKFLFPNAREIMLVRDPRDMLCSYNSFWGASLVDAVAMLSDRLKMLMVIKSEQRALIVRYEDLILDEHATLADVCRYLELPHAFSSPEKDSDQIFRSHGTSGTVAASIGRWKVDLDDGALAAIEKWGEFLAEFGYAP